MAEATVWVDCPCHGTPVRSFSLQDKIPARLACDFGGPQFEVEPEHRRLVFRFPAPGEAKELPPGGTSAGGLLRRILKTRFERIAEGASALRAATRRGRRDPGPGSPAGRSDAELTAETRATGLGAKIAVAAAADTDPPLGKIGRRSGRQRRVALLLLLLLVITLLVLRAWAPGLSGFETTVVRVLVVLSTVVVAYCLPEGFFNLVLKLLQKLFLAVLTAILMPFVLKALAPYLGLPLP